MEVTEASGYELVVAFPDQSNSFAHGFEAGKIYARLERTNVGEGSAAAFCTLIHPENSEVLRRVAQHLGWKVEFEPSTEAPDQWHKAEFTKSGPSRDKPNPHGLRIVGD